MHLKLCFLFSVYLSANGFILNGVTITHLPQYAKYGKSMVLVGGNLQDNNTEIYNTIVEMAGGRGVAKIGIINAASATPLDGYHFYRDIFLRYGALEANRIPIDLNHTGNNNNDSVIRLIYQQSGFFFGGGDQYRIIQSFLNMTSGEYSPALKALHQMYDHGALVAGTSAGCTCQTDNFMMRAGTSWDALRYGSSKTAASSAGNEYVVYAEQGGLGFVKNYVVDSHFSQRGREGRMIRLLADTKSLTKGTAHGFGVDENTAMVITHADTNQITAKVIGQSGVTFFDLSKASVDASARYFTVRDVFMTYLISGDVINLQDKTITFSLLKTPLKRHEKYEHALTTNDVFGGSSLSSGRKAEFVRIATSIYDAKVDRSTSGRTHQAHPTFRISLFRTGYDSEGWVERKHSFHTDITSYKNMYLEITEI